MLQAATLVDTTVLQINPNRPENLQQQITAKPYSGVRIGDEINAFCGRVYKRCRVTAKVDEGDFVRLTLCPISRSFLRDISQRRFLGTALAEVYLERTPSRKAAFAQYQELILAVVQPGQIYTLRGLGDAIALHTGKKIPKYLLSAPGKQLVRRGELFERRVGRSLAFRAPLPRDAGYPVVEFAGKDSQQLGWIVNWRWFHSTQCLQPVVRFLDGVERFSSEDRLDPVETPLQKKQIEVARRTHAGEPVEREVEISEWLLSELRQTWGDRKARTEPMLHLAKLLGYLPESALSFCSHSGEPWNQTMSYLETYYPGWQQGRAA